MFMRYLGGGVGHAAVMQTGSNIHWQSSTCVIDDDDADDEEVVGVDGPEYVSDPDSDEESDEVTDDEEGNSFLFGRRILMHVGSYSGVYCVVLSEPL